MPIVNQRTGESIASHIEMATTRTARRKGLLGRNRFEPGSALALVPCTAIHTLFMRFAIDVVFLDREGRALRICRRLKPWRIAVAPLARTVIELPSGQLDRLDVRLGDRFVMVPGGEA
jgi:uncharacterized membrane protein (UPF0127 family)